MELSWAEHTRTRLNAWQVARPVLYAVISQEPQLQDTDRFVANVTGVSTEAVHRAKVIGASSLVGEIEINNYRLVLNRDNVKAMQAANASEFDTASGAVIPRDQLMQLISYQVAIDDANSALQAKIRAIHASAVE